MMNSSSHLGCEELSPLLLLLLLLLLVLEDTMRVQVLLPVPFELPLGIMYEKRVLYHA
jgi:uncharacterized integral membrane protein